MTSRTSIEWTHMPGYVGAVWNPTTGCTRVSAGCDQCYAFELHDRRYKANRDASRAIGDATIADTRRQQDEADDSDVQPLPFPQQYDLPFSRVQLLEDRLDVPLRTKKPTCYFVDSMADLFHEDVPDEFIAKVWWTMVQATQHRFLILTKRPERMRAWLTKEPTVGANVIAPNIWLGTSVEDQRAANERIPHLLATPAAVRFLSCEPLLGPVDLRKQYGWLRCDKCCWRDGPGANEEACVRDHVWRADCRDCGGTGRGPLHWVIVGGESGSRARPMDLVWMRSLVEQCKSAGVPIFVKQLGSKPVGLDRDCDVCKLGIKAPRREHGLDCMGPLHESHGRDMSEWPEDLRVREFPR